MTSAGRGLVALGIVAVVVAVLVGLTHAPPETTTSRAAGETETAPPRQESDVPVDQDEASRLDSAESSARIFLASYLPRDSSGSRRIASATRELQTRLERERPRRPAGVPPARARVLSVSSIAEGIDAVTSTATVLAARGSPPYSLVLSLERQPDGRWLVARVGEP